MTQPPTDPKDQPGAEVGDVPGIRLPAIEEDVSGAHEAVLFVPDGLNPADVLKVKVVKLQPPAMGAVIQRRC